MKTIGIITIHKVYNYGSILQAFALQTVCERLGFQVEIIDYRFPNAFHFAKMECESHKKNVKAFILKLCYGLALYKQHRAIDCFVSQYLHLSERKYASPDELKASPPQYDIYMTGSDQVWNPRYCYGDPSFLLHFVPAGRGKIAYAASIGNVIAEKSIADEYKKLLAEYQAISVRELSSRFLLQKLIHKDVPVVLDPTLLLSPSEWAKLMRKPQQQEKYILCYYLNYSFDPYPYVDQLTTYLHEQTGYKIVRIVRPPERLLNRKMNFRVGLAVGDFLSLIAGASLVVTTSFHGTAFALNFSVPLFSVVAHRDGTDSRQISLLESVGLGARVLALGDPYPTKEQLPCDYGAAQKKLELLRKDSLAFLKNSLNVE